MKITCLSLFFILLINNAIAQTIDYCGTVEYQLGLMTKHPGMKAVADANEQRLFLMASGERPGARSGQVVLDVPVVVHVVHMNGPENIADSVVFSAIDALNLRFRNMAPYQHPTGHDMQIQFCLASVDPWGNPTNGITRTVSNCTNLGQSPGATELVMKNTIRWEPMLYMNIWVINSLPPGTNVAGYATGPSWAGSTYDGIVIIDEYMNGSDVLTHEAGHYLGLHHTWEGGCTNFNCLLDGDRVCDTPPDNTNNYECMLNSCTTDMDDTTGFNPFITDMDELPNYMDYTNCPLSFSSGQGERMTNALTGIRDELLLSNGCGANPTGTIPVASFTMTTGCPNNYFINTSTNAVGASWDFNGDGLIDAAGNQVAYAFPATGYYDITLYSFGYGGVDTITQNMFVPVRPYPNYPLQNTSGISLSVMAQQFVYCGNPVITISGEPGMVSYNWSTGDTTQNISFTPSGAFTVSLTCVDSAGISWTSCTPVHAIPAPATIPPVLSIISNDTILCMDDLYEDITLFADFSPLMLFNTWFGPNSVIPNFSDSILTVTLTSMYNTFFVNQIDSNGCSSQSNIIHADLAYVPFGLSMTQNGDTLFCISPNVSVQWYLDGQPIPGATGNTLVMSTSGCYSAYGWYSDPDCGLFTQDTVCFVASGISDVHGTGGTFVYPNPVEHMLNVKGIMGEKSFTLYDVSGKVWLTGRLNEKTGIDMEKLSDGMYFLRMGSEYFKIIKRR